MTFYEILDVPESATQTEIRNSYKKLVKKYHPDIYPGDKNYAKQKMQKINEAYDILSDESARKLYDEELHPKPIQNYDSSDVINNIHHEYENYKYTNSNYNIRYTSTYSNYSTRSNYYTSKGNTSNTSYTQNHSEASLFNFPKYMWLLISICALIYLFIIIQSYTYYISKQKNSYNNSTYSNTQTHSQNTTYNQTKPKYQKKYKNFNINEYVSDSTLIKYYHTYYINDFDNYTDFKNYFSDIFYEYYFVENNIQN